jgi:hypothetical protein
MADPDHRARILEGCLEMEPTLLAYGYEIRCEELPKERGSSAATKHCIAIKGGVEHFAFVVRYPDHPDHYRRIQRIQGSIPHMARMVGPMEDIVLLERAHGQKLWEMNAAPDYAEVVERQLIEFALGTQKSQLIHGDLRPWNVFFDSDRGVQVIDWWNLSSFIDDLVGDPPRRRDLVENHYRTFYPKLVAEGNFTGIDLADARLIGKLLRGEIRRLTEAWPPADRRPWYPPWCQH